MNLFDIEKAGDKGAGRPFPLHPKSPPNLLCFASDHLSRTTSLDEAEHFLHNHHASVASLRRLFTFAPERRSASERNQRSPSPEYPTERPTHTFGALRGKPASLEILGTLLLYLFYVMAAIVTELCNIFAIALRYVSFRRCPAV
jgi:hypothetical protein